MVHPVWPINSIVGIKLAQDLIMRAFLTTSISIASALALSLAPSAALSAPKDIWDTAAAKTGIDKKDIQSICITESGIKFNDGYRRPWPYVLNSSYGPMFFHTREKASEMLAHLISLKVKNIDVGMCQLNLAYHGHRVTNPHDLLDPVVNLNVASDYLKELMRRYNGDIVNVVAAYHTGSLGKKEQVDRGQNYVNSVIKVKGKLSQ